MTRLQRTSRAICLAAIVLGSFRDAHAHSGPPFPIVSDQLAGRYQVSIWTDPDSTDDGSAAGQFWIMIYLPGGKSAPPADTHAVVTVTPLDRAGPARTARASATDGNVSHQFAAVPLDHEGPFAVHVTIAGAAGDAVVDGTVDATYDLRPARWLLGLYVMPFLAVGLLWLKLLVSRRRAR